VKGVGCRATAHWYYHQGTYLYKAAAKLLQRMVKLTQL